jgi:hypothetical protein
LKFFLSSNVLRIKPHVVDGGGVVGGGDLEPTMNTFCQKSSPNTQTNTINTTNTIYIQPIPYNQYNPF